MEWYKRKTHLPVRRQIPYIDIHGEPHPTVQIEGSQAVFGKVDYHRRLREAVAKPAVSFEGQPQLLNAGVQKR